MDEQWRAGRWRVLTMLTFTGVGACGEPDFGGPGVTEMVVRDSAGVRVVAFPMGFDLQSVRNGRAYGIHEDELGIQRPQVYEVPR